jgi:hypothetical protein
VEEGTKDPACPVNPPVAERGAVVSSQITLTLQGHGWILPIWGSGNKEGKFLDSCRQRATVMAETGIGLRWARRDQFEFRIGATTIGWTCLSRVAPGGWPLHVFQHLPQLKLSCERTAHARHARLRFGPKSIQMQCGVGTDSRANDTHGLHHNADAPLRRVSTSHQTDV